MRCLRCGEERTELNILGWCSSCYTHAMNVEVLQRLQHWMTEAEMRYGQSIFYSSEVPAERRVTRTDTHNGLARGFKARMKNFTLIPGMKPSIAIRSFITGDLTICECQGLFIAVLFNAICDILGNELFDTIFRDFAIETDFMRGPIGIARAITSVTPLGGREEPVCYGDWVYILNTELERFRAGVERGRYDPAASGWNLLCVNAGHPKMYMGLGLSEVRGRAAALTLEQIKIHMLSPPEGYREKTRAPSARRGSVTKEDLRGMRARDIFPDAIVLQTRRYLDSVKFLAWARSRILPQ